MSYELFLTTLGIGSGTILGVGLGTAVLLWCIKTSVQTLAAGAKAAAEEGAKAAINDMHWRETLRQEIEKSRGVERQELRFKSYGELWHKMRPLAIYTEGSIDAATLSKLHENLTNWYFSDNGGMFLLPHTREFYFALQDFSRAVGDAKCWECKRVSGDYVSTFDRIIDIHNPGLMRRLREAISKPERWPDGVETISTEWRNAIKALGVHWDEMTDNLERFATIQQIGSILRTVVVNDVESRLR
jgi:hypothetical protein